MTCKHDWKLIQLETESNFLMDCFGFKRYIWTNYCPKCKEVLVERAIK